MTELDHPAGCWSPVTLSNDKAPSPIRACSLHAQPAPAAWGPLTADARPIAEPVPSRAGRHATHLDPTTGSVRSC
jgi:hypothetical protein